MWACQRELVGQQLCNREQEQEKDWKNREGRCVSLLVAGSHLLLSCLGFSSASYLKVHVKTHHGVPLPQVSRHQESIPNGGAAFHCGRTYGIKGKRLAALHPAALGRALCCGVLGWARERGGRKDRENTGEKLREMQRNHAGCNTSYWTAKLTSLGEGNGHRRVCEVLAASSIGRIEKAMLVHLIPLPWSSQHLNFAWRQVP